MKEMRELKNVLELLGNADRQDTKFVGSLRYL